MAMSDFTVDVCLLLPPASDALMCGSTLLPPVLPSSHPSLSFFPQCSTLLLFILINLFLIEG